ncbi:hypothetical protein [Microviridae sp.]|nr:hypothetical protein [Microviridae sp.]
MGLPLNTKQTSSNMSALGAAGIGAGADLISGIFNIGQARKQRKHERELAKYSYEQQREMIREQNQYNSPANQANLYEEAGYNRHLGLGDFKPQTDIAKYNPPPQEYGKIDAQIGTRAVDKYQQARMTNVQTNNLRAQTDYTNAQRRKTNIDALGSALNNKKVAAFIPKELERIQADINKTNAGTSHIEEQKKGQIIKNAMSSLEKAYMKKHKRKMPSQTWDAALQKILSKLDDSNFNPLNWELEDFIPSQLRH